mgnify:CR=1 FL=1
MADIFFYLLENYAGITQCPDAATLARRLAYEGFEENEVRAAIAWVELLRQDIEAVAEVATASTERATAMRQSSPVACVLGREERNAFWAAWSPPETPEPPIKAASDALVWPVFP